MRPRKLRRLLALAGLGAVAAGLTLGTGIAKADSGDLVAWASDHGFTGTATAVAVRGSLVCADLANGLNGEAAARDLWLNTGIDDLNDARQFVIAAVVTLCPEYDHRGEQKA
jgi:hypothetical protein